VFDSHNAEFLRLGTMSASQPLLSRGLVARVQRRTVRRYEADVVRSVAATLAVSEEERRYFDELAPGRVRLAPNGVDVEGLRPRGGLPGEPRFLFMGSLSYSANLDALKYLVSDILPKLKRRDALLTIVGSRPPASVAAIAQRSPIATHLAGFVPETRPYVEANRFLVVPLRVGGGTRIKILDALAQGLPVITTTVGCAGLKVEHLRDVVVADDPADFARWIDRLLEDDELAGRLAERGRQTVERHYGWKDIGAKVHEALVETSERGVLLPPTNAVETASR
jgi:glycosyltransferase involved in cell wall biosynthesis